MVHNYLRLLPFTLLLTMFPDVAFRNCFSFLWKYETYTVYKYKIIYIQPPTHLNMTTRTNITIHDSIQSRSCYNYWRHRRQPYYQILDETNATLWRVGQLDSLSVTNSWGYQNNNNNTLHKNNIIPYYVCVYKQLLNGIFWSILRNIPCPCMKVSPICQWWG